MGTGFMSGLKSYTDGKWSEFDEKLKANFDDPRSVEFTEAWVGMIRDSGPANWANMQWYDAMEAFTAGQAGMIVDADFFAAGYEDPAKSKVAGKVGYALIPAGPGGQTRAGLWTWALGINKATKNKDAAWLFIEWATAQRTLLNATLGYRNYDPSRTSVTNDPRVKEIMEPWGGGSYLKTVAENLETASVAWVPESERQRIGDIWARALQEIYFQRLSAADALKKASDETDKVMKEAGIKCIGMSMSAMRKRQQHLQQDRWLPYLLLSPALILLVGMAYPFGLGLYYSLTNYWLQYPNRFRFVWFDNYMSLLRNRCLAGRCNLRLVYPGGGRCPGWAGARGGAVPALTHPGPNVIRALMLMPLMIPPVITALMWKIMMASTDAGILNYMLSFVGVDPINWFGSPSGAVVSVLLIDTWGNLPFVALILLGALQALPTEPYEAARVDGASPLAVLRYITLPLLSPFLSWR